MADNSLIEWTGATWNPITGCSIVSPGCTNCYAMRLAGTRMKHHPSRAGLTVDSKAGPVWNGKVRFNEQWLDQPLRWKRPRMIFVCAHGDLFAEGVPDEWIDRIFLVMAQARQHTFQVLTKRADRMRDYMNQFRALGARVVKDGPRSVDFRHGNRFLMLEGDQQWPLENVWMGVSAEDHKRARERLPLLRETPAAVRWVSAEPLLGPIDTSLRGIDWLVAGGESGRGARPMHPNWARDLRDRCEREGVAFFFKQWGEWAPHVGAVDGWTIDDDPESSRFDHRDWDGDRWSEPYRPMWCDELDEDTVSRIGKKRAGRLLDGVEHSAMPGGAG